MCGGEKPPTSKRADFIIPLCNGQAFYLLLLFCTLIEESQDIHFFAVDQNPGAFGFDIGDKNCSKSCFIHGNKVSGFIGDDGGEVKTTGDFDFALNFIDLRRQPGR